MAGSSNVTGRKTKKRKGQSLASSGDSISLTTLQELNHQSQKTYGKAQKTLTAYAGYIAKGKEFLALTVKACHEKGESQEKDGINTKLLEKAFDKPPNRFC